MAGPSVIRPAMLDEAIVGLERVDTVRHAFQCARGWISDQQWFRSVLTAEQYFDFCHTIVEAADDQELREVFRQTLVVWLELNFSEIAEASARKQHPITVLLPSMD